MKPLRTIGLILISASLAFAAPPATKKEPVTDAYHGTKVVDEYRWLENYKHQEVKAWSDAENAYARAYLDKLPGREKLKKRVAEILEAKTVAHYNLAYRPGMLFAMKRLPPKQQPFLVVMPSAREPDKGRTLVDPTKIDAKGTTSIDWYVPSPDGSLVAVSLSKAGSEAGDVHIYETSTGKAIADVIPRVQNGTAGGDLAWTPDGKGFFYTRYPRGKGARRRMRIFTNRPGSTNSARRRKRIALRSARSSRGLARFAFSCIRRRDGCWSRCRMATAANSPITCAGRTANTANSATSAIAPFRHSSDRMAKSLPCR